MSSLASALAARGHFVSVIAQADVGSRLSAPGIEFHAVGRATHPPGSLAETERRMGTPGGPIGMRQIIDQVARTTDMLAGEGAQAARSLRIDAVVTDQVEPAGALVAEHLGLPYVSVANALLLNREPDVPPAYTGWQYDPSDWGRRRNHGGYRVIDLLMHPVGSVIASWCRRWGLRPKQRIEDCLSPYAQITQTVPGFDFPRRELPEIVHSCGPLRREDREGDLVLPDTGESSPGLRDARHVARWTGDLFRKIAEACRRLNLVLLVAHGGRMTQAEAAALPGNPIVHAFVPQAAVLRHTALAVSNGGLNTVLDALCLCGSGRRDPDRLRTASHCRPPRAVPARERRLGGVGPGAVWPGRMRLARVIETVMRGDQFRWRAAALAEEIGRAGGVARAADIVERVIGDGPAGDASGVRRSRESTGNASGTAI